jgi:hypothetical protein
MLKMTALDSLEVAELEPDEHRKERPEEQKTIDDGR